MALFALWLVDATNTLSAPRVTLDCLGWLVLGSHAIGIPTRYSSDSPAHDSPALVAHGFDWCGVAHRLPLLDQSAPPWL